MAAISDKLVDRRIIERNIRKGLVSEQDYEDYLAKLSDQSSNFDLVQPYDDEKEE